MATTTLYEEVSLQADRRRAGAKLIKIISDLWYDKSIEMVLFRNQMLDRNVSDTSTYTNMQLNLWVNLFQYLILRLQKPF
jgi:hypothetical protein